MIKTKKPVKKPADLHEAEKKQKAFINGGTAEVLKTFPIKLSADELFRIKKCCEARKASTRKSISTHDWIVEAVQTQLEQEESRRL